MVFDMFFELLQHRPKLRKKNELYSTGGGVRNNLKYTMRKNNFCVVLELVFSYPSRGLILAPLQL
tara:strand:+ start:292 stop:486 length:195 start_codon:yes stop_codon:yes gene_type:complete